MEPPGEQAYLGKQGAEKLQTAPKILLAVRGTQHPVQEPWMQTARRSPTMPRNKPRASMVQGSRNEPLTSLGGKRWWTKIAMILSGRRVFVSNLPKQAAWWTMKDHLRRKTGSVTFAELLKDSGRRPSSQSVAKCKHEETAWKIAEVINYWDLRGRTVKRGRNQNGQGVLRGSRGRARRSWVPLGIRTHQGWQER